MPVKAISKAVTWVPPNSGQSFEVVYTPKPSLPVLDSDSFTYGVSGSDNDILDNYLCVKAARKLKVKENELIGGLEQEHEQLKKAVSYLHSGPDVVSMPLSSLYGSNIKSPFGWFKKNNSTIQIVFSYSLV